MKKSLLALAVLGAFAGAASAQSTVTLYGRVDLSFAKNIGSEEKEIQNGSGSRLGVRGVEDLGGGLKALFQIEHRFNADTGLVGSGGEAVNPRFWHGRSIVGLEGGFGRVWLGREYTPAFLMGELLSDPWGCDTIAQICFTGSGASRNDNTVNYQFSAAGFTGWVQIAEADGIGVPLGPDRPVGFALTYGAGPLYVAWGYDDQAGVNDKYNHFTANYDFGAFKLWSGFGTGKTNADAKIRSWQVAATMPIGGGELRFGHGQQKIAGTKVTQLTSLGYHYAMSKRTTLYFDVANNSKATTPIGSPEKNGYDLGIKHNF